MTTPGLAAAGSHVGASAVRIAAVDVTRLVAIIGMMAAHLLPPLTGVPGEALTAATHGFPSTLFGVVAGIATVVAADRRMRAGRDAEAIGAQIARGLTVALVGVVLVMLPTFVAVVLVPLGVAILIAAPLLRASTPALAAIAAGLAIGGPLLIAQLAAASTAGTIGPVQANLDRVLFTGTYPVLTWIVFVIVGMLIGRALLAAIARGRTVGLGIRLALTGAIALVVAGLVDAWYVSTVAAPARADGVLSDIPSIIEALGESGYGIPHGTGWDAILIAAPHTGATLDLVRTIGGAALVFGVVLLVVGGGAARSRLTRVLAAAGGAAFTMYVLHILTTIGLTAATMTGAIEPYTLDIPALVINLVLLLALGTLLALTRLRGPFETLVRAAGMLGARITARLTDRASRAPRGTA